MMKIKVINQIVKLLFIYLKYGFEQMINMLDGVFAFILVDTNTKNIFISRDLYGVRPLFFQRDSNHWMFASELKQLNGLMHIAIKNQFSPGTYTQINYNIVNERFTKYISIIDNKPYRSKYTPFYSTFSSYSMEDYCAKINHSLTEAVRKRVNNTDREIACLLSGGLDSSLITALVKKLCPEKQLTTWSIGLKGSEDLKYARLVADYLGTVHNEIIISEEDFLSCFESVIYAIESYDTTTVRASVGNWLISKYIKENSDCNHFQWRRI